MKSHKVQLTLGRAHDTMLRNMKKVIRHEGWEEHVETLPSLCGHRLPASCAALSCEIFAGHGPCAEIPLDTETVISPALSGSRLRWTSQRNLTTPVIENGTTVGVLVDAPAARYLYIYPIVTSAGSAQVAHVFERMQRILEIAGMRIDDLVRTWFYNRDILSWYDAFNDERRAVFSEAGIIRFPASTCVGAENSLGGSCLARALAIQPKGASIAIRQVWSPMQGEAAGYGSQFSRAILVEDAVAKTLYVSGTASIGDDGKTKFAGDPGRQVRLTMDVVLELLHANGMALADVVSGVGYFAHIGCVSAWEDFLRREGFRDLPVLRAIGTICRSDLLFEIELEASLERQTS